MTAMASSSDLHDERSAARAIARELATVRRTAGAKPRIAVLTHERPDGDAIGSCVALASMLRGAGYAAAAVGVGEVPRQFTFLAGAGAIVGPEAFAAPPALAFSLDATDPSRHGAARALIEGAARAVVIDHHASNTRFGAVNWVDEGAAAVGEMIWALARRLRLAVGPDAAEGLYAAVMTDTGRFTFGNTTVRSFEMAADLVRGGLDPARVAEGVYGGRPRGEWDLEARLRSSLRLAAGGRIATVELSARDFSETGTTSAAAMDFASLPRTIAGVEIAIFFYEIDGGARTKVGLRSAAPVDVNRLAGRLGGGGHPQASGCLVEGGRAAARRIVLREARRHLGARGVERGRR
jgi:phosphoesterase RecJ-like protein